jgi:hypothetical protein
VLNPHARERFTRCPRCEASTRVRKIPLVIHVDSVGLVLMRKTCRLCIVCEMLIADQAELERLIDALGEREGGSENTWSSALCNAVTSGAW